MAKSKIKMKVHDPFVIINEVVDQYNLRVPEYIIRLEYFEDDDGASLTAFFSNEEAVDNDSISSNVVLGLSIEAKPVFLEVFM